MERVYETLKQNIRDRGLRPGARLDPAALASTLTSSATPIREALHVLAGEGLVEMRHGGGFWVPQVDEPGLRDLYAWSCDVSLLALRRTLPPDDRIGTESWPDDLADRAEMIFVRIGRLSSNAEHARAIASANDRLHAARTIEPVVLPNIVAELASIAAALHERDSRALRRLIGAYCRRRAKVAAEIVRRLYRDDNNRDGI